MEPHNLFQAFALALALSFFFGLAFEDFYGRAKEARPGGIRTFPLLTLAGALLYLLDPQRLIPLSAGLASLGVWLAIYYWRRTTEKNAEGEEAVGLMVPVCNVIAFLLGPVAIAQPLWVPGGVTAAAVLFLTSRERLHRFARAIEISELVTAGKFLVLTGLILPLLPDHPITVLTTITPRQAWLALIAVSSISYASYLLQRYILPRGGGTLLIAILGGLYSSTATTVALARQLQGHSDRGRELQAGIVLSTAVMYLRILTIVAIFNLPLAARLCIPVSVLGICAAVIAASCSRQSKAQPVPAASPTPPNPLAVSTATAFALLFVLISVATNWVRVHFGTSGVYTLAGLVGFADVDPFVLNLAERGVEDISMVTAATAIILAASSNNLLKAGYVLRIAGRRHGGVPAAGLMVLALAGAGAGFWLSGQ
jgi:uncharacterized membrane protein (DUF4010 family)